ncbi:MAG TPA: histidine kinase N-terminal 7TM domain-containing protein, partial [Chloroflexota bacterium]|nr:histidine kinase N-terminal 7TM domain-containing protein [Chloroflexota bacterium]
TCLFQALSFLPSTLDPKLALTYVYFGTIQVAAYSFVWFSVEYALQDGGQARRWLAPFAILPALLVVAFWTNPWLHQFWLSVRLDTTTPFPTLVTRHNWAEYATAAFDLSCGIVARVVLIGVALAHRGLYRRQMVPLVLAATPGLLDILFYTGHSPLRQVNLFGPGLAIFALVVAWALLGNHLLDVLPVAHGLVMDALEDMVIILDTQGRVVYLNRAATAIVQGSNVFGQPLQAVAPDLALYLSLARGSEPTSHHLRDIDGKRHTFQVQARPLRSGGLLSRGTSIVLHDVTDNELVLALERSRQQVIAAEEHARRALADMLHGSVQSKLLTLWMRLRDVEDRWGQDVEATAELAAIREGLERVSDGDVRNISHLLHPAIIRFGLVPAVQELADRFFGALDVRISTNEELRQLDVVGSERLDENVRLAMYRVVEEALTNTLKHAQARAAVVRLDVADGVLGLSVEDDGHGFDSAAPSAGFGLSGMAARVEQLGGMLRLESALGRGTHITAAVPLARRPAEAL